MYRNYLAVAVMLFLSIKVIGQNKMPIQRSLLTYVDPLIGTAISTTESAKRHSQDGTELRGQTFPAVGVPHGMTSWTPQTRATENKCVAPYYYEDKYIQGFRGSHWLSGSCTQDYGSMTIMPMTGELEIDPVKRASSFSHDKEFASPSSYFVWLKEYNIQVDMSAVSHSGILQFSFPKKDKAFIIVEPNSDEGEGYVSINAAKNEIVGYNPVHRIYQGLGKPAGFSGYFVVVFDTPFEDYGTWNGSVITSKKIQQKGSATAVGAFIRLALKNRTVVKAKAGFSFTSIEEARKNLRAEIPFWDLNQVKQQTSRKWNNELEKVAIKGGTEQDKIMFYTAMYHSKLLPRVVSDVSGTYNAFASMKKVLTAKDYPHYDDFSLWDTYRAVHPLLTILEPKRTVDMVRSLIDKADQGGWLPIFPCWNSYTSAMVGDHAISMIGDALMKGLAGDYAEKAYQVMRKNAFVVNNDLTEYQDGKGRRALASYLKYGFIPLEDSVLDAFHKEEQVSRTLEYAYNDFVLSRVAGKLGKKNDYEILKHRANNYKNVFDTTTGYVRGRFASGEWISPFDPFALRSSFITEGSPFQYTWYVPQDVLGLIKLMGGKEKFNNRLDTLFNKRYYWHGNEPGHQTAYFYSFAGYPWKTQNQIREIIGEEYSTGAGGLSGNEDAGQMSAWLVFSMMGFYPVCPGIPEYILGTPSFEEVSISVERGKKFTILAENVSKENKYIQSATLNGLELKKPILTHQQLVNGGKLLLKMGPNPDKQWGAETAETSLLEINK